VLRPLSEQALNFDCSPCNLVGHREVLEGCALCAEVTVLGTRSGTVEDLKVDDGARTDEPPVYVRHENCSDRSVT
jgi:hypothetical protein